MLSIFRWLRHYYDSFCQVHPNTDFSGPVKIGAINIKEFGDFVIVQLEPVSKLGLKRFYVGLVIQRGKLAGIDPRW